jgi:hypothetical protein
MAVKLFAGGAGKILALSQSHFVPPTSLILNSRRHEGDSLLTTWPKPALAITAFPIPGWSKDRPMRGRAFLDGRRRDHSTR